MAAWYIKHMPFPQIVVSEQEAKEAVDKEIEAFDKYFQMELKNEPLVHVERAILSTYLFWKTRQEKPHGV